MARDEEALKAIGEQAAAVLTAAGFPKMPARVLMALTYAENGGLTAQELADHLGASAAAISGAVRYLQTINFVRRIAQPGSRRDRYESPDNAWYLAVMNERPIYGVLATLAESARTAIDEPDSEAAKRADDLARFYRFLEARLPEVMQEWETIRAQR
jgi:DNA-binding transcriptional regulator GbsR (MarR family)